MDQSPGFEPRLLRSPKDFEVAAADWMRIWGFTDVRVAPRGPDGGIDVESKEAVVQVKAWMVPIGSPDIQRLRGAAYDGRKAIFFSLSEFTNAAKIFAERAGVALFRFAGYNGEIEPVNALAQELLEEVAEEDDLLSEEASRGEARPSIIRLVRETLDIVIEWSNAFATLAINRSPRFVQFVISDGSLVVESVGQYFLEAGDLLTEQEMALLIELGWPPPGSENYQLLFEEDPLPLDRIAELLTSTLMLVHYARGVSDIEVYIDRARPAPKATSGQRSKKTGK